jgi:hypothetical protein
MWLPMKFGESFATTTPFPSRWSANQDTRAVTCGSVSGVGMSSRRCRYRGGLKKCVPSQCCRKSALRPSASAPIGIPDVFEDTIDAGRRSRSTRSSRARLASSCSTIASTIQSASLSAGRSSSSPPVVISAAAAVLKNGSGLSRCTRFNPSRAMPSVMSSSVTGMPALARWAAI